jgi:hypothetical protein
MADRIVRIRPEGGAGSAVKLDPQGPFKRDLYDVPVNVA